MKAYRSTRNSLNPFEEVDKAPKNHVDLANRILLYESFKEGLDVLEDMFNKDEPTSVILNGYPASGKTTLMRLAQFRTAKKAIYINSDMFTNDVSALHYLLGEVEIKKSSSMMKETLSDTLVAIKKNKTQFKEKFIVVLCDFEQFCKKSQSLLYNLNEMLQAGINMSLVGITSSRDCTEYMEKRVRSRMSASFFHLDVPYHNCEEYVMFAKHLVGASNMTPDFKLILARHFNIMDRSLPGLKRFLISNCSFDSKKLKLQKKKPEDYVPRDGNIALLQEQVDWLPDLYVLTRIVAFCKRNSDNVTNHFKLSDVITWHKTCMMDINTRRFNLEALRTLMKANMIARLRESERVGLETDFVLLITFKFFKRLVERNPHLGDVLGDRIYSLR